MAILNGGQVCRPTTSEIMAVYGHVGEFNRDTDDWKSYIEQMNCFFDANGIDKDDRKRAILLSSCGSQTYRLLRSLVSPVKPDTKPYKEIVKILNDHFSPEPSIAQQQKPRKRSVGCKLCC